MTPPNASANDCSPSTSDAVAKLPADRYAPWNPAEQFMRHGRSRLAAKLLHQAGVFPDAASQCLEIGFGGGGWLPESAGRGARQKRTSTASRSTPLASTRAGAVCPRRD